MQIAEHLPSVVESPPMAAKNPDEVRLTALMMRGERQRIRMVALRLGVPVEKLATQWLLERCEIEESQKPSPAKQKRK